MSQIIPTRSSNPCAICENTTGKCRTVNNLHLCMTLTDNSISVPGFRFLGRTKDDLWGKWIEDTHQEWNASKREQRQRERRQFQEQRKHEESQRSATSLSADERDYYYQQLLAQLELHPVDFQDLQRRGLSDEQIQAEGIKSVETLQKLEKLLPDTLPGVNLTGEQMNVFGPGYLWPIQDVHGRVVGCQLRLREAEPGERYRWLTSKTKERPYGPTSHLPNGELPLSVHRPQQIQRGAIGLTEGTGAKPFILCQRRGQVTIGASGGLFASSPQTFKYTLAVLSAELGTREIEFYPDAGSIINSHVMHQYRATWKMLEQLGYSVQVAWWGQETQAAPDIDELDDFTKIQWLTTAEFQALSQSHLNWLEQIKQNLQRAPKPKDSATASCQKLDGSDPNMVEYAVGERHSTWQQASRQRYRFILDQSPPGTGKSFDAGATQPSDLNALQLIYLSNQHRNPTVETLDSTHGWVDLEARHAGLVRETTPGGGSRLKRAVRQESSSVPANCNRIEVIHALQAKHIPGANTAALICGTCLLKEACTRAEGPSYGFLHQRQLALSSPKTRAHPNSLPMPQEDNYETVALIWDEPGQNFVTKREISVTLIDLEQTRNALMSDPELFEQIQDFVVTLRLTLKSESALGRYGLNHKEVMQQLKAPFIDLERLERALQPDLSFLNPTAKYGEDIENLPVRLRKQFSKRNTEVVEQAKQQVVKQWLPDLLRVLTGCLKGYVHIKRGQLILSLPDERHREIAHAAKAVIFLDATLSRQDLALKLNCDPKDIFVCRQQVKEYGNLTLIQVMDLGRMGMQRGKEQQRRAEAIIDHYRALDSRTKVIDFKQFAQDGDGAWWRDSRGVNDFIDTDTLILIGTPCRNLADLQAEYAILTGVYDPEDDGMTAFINRTTLGDMEQALRRLRADRRPNETLQVIILSNFALNSPTQQVKASSITLKAAGQKESLILAAKAAAETLRLQGKKVTQTAIAKMIGYSQQRISQIWKLLNSLLEYSNSKISKNSSLIADGEEADLVAGANQVITTLVEEDNSEALLEAVSEIFLDWLTPQQWPMVWQLLPIEAHIRVLSSLLPLLPRDTLIILKGFDLAH